MRIFAMNDCDWMAAETLESAVAEYLKEHASGASAEDILEDPHELSDEQMDSYTFVNEEDPPERGTFREQLSKLIADGAAFPCLFASTEY